MMDRKDETQGDVRNERPYESPVIRTHKREELAAKAMPINACTSFFPLEDET